MDGKYIELAYLRNHLRSSIFNDADFQLIEKIKEKVEKSNTPIHNCQRDILKKDFALAEQEINLIHNFPFDNYQLWDSDHFYKIELLSYLEGVDKVIRIKQLISSLARLQEELKK
jgi:hypothetical protein